MSSTSARTDARSEPIEFKSTTVSLPVLRVSTDDLSVVDAFLEQKLRQAPEFFRNTPIVLEVEATATSIDLATLTDRLRQAGLMPVGVRGGVGLQVDELSKIQLAVLADARHIETSSNRTNSSETKSPKSQSNRLGPANGTKVIDQPIRSGQRIYADGGDLIVLSAVSAGAELMADGNIHVYGVLRGRALAGVRGNVTSRIFCSHLQAELLSIAGHYKVSENLDKTFHDKQVQIYLSDNSLIIESL